MKANELMIGDWVEVIKSDHLKFVQVGEIRRNSIITMQAEYEEEEIDIQNIKPIPLTGKILKGNGFIEDETANCYEYWGDEVDNVYIRVFFDKFGTPISYHIQMPSNGSQVELVDNVHELQNALNISRTPKKIWL